MSSLKLVKAMDLCQFTEEDPALPQKTWGVIAADYLLADGSPAPAPKNIQFGVLPNFGPNVLPQYGETLAMLSSGTARREGDPGFVHPKSGPAAGQNGNFDAQTSCPAPAGYLAAHGGSLPSQCGSCMGPDCATAFDSAQLRVRIRPPTNAKGFSYRLSFYSSEYPQYVCQDYNDFFLTLLSGNVTPEIPADGNVAFDDTEQPISVNNLLFDVCLPSPGYPCQGETLEIRFTLWDGGDHHVDSAVLLDRFRWSPQPVTLDTHD